MQITFAARSAAQENQEVVGTYLSFHTHENIFNDPAARDRLPTFDNLREAERWTALEICRVARISDGGLSVLANASNLARLDLERAEVTDEG